MAVGIGNHSFPVVRFVPFLKGTVDAGAATGVRKLFFQATPGFFWLQKKWGVDLKFPLHFIPTKPTKTFRKCARKSPKWGKI